MAEDGDFQKDRTDVHGNDREAVGHTHDVARREDDTVLAYARHSNVTGADFNGSVRENEALIAQDGDGSRASERRARRAAQQTADQILLAQMNAHFEAANAIDDYLAAGNFAVGEDGRLEDERMEQELRDYERRMGLPPGSIDRHDTAAVRRALEDQRDYHLQQGHDIARRVDAGRDISASIRSGSSASAAIAGQSTAAVDDAARRLAQDNIDAAREIYEASGIDEDEIDVNVEIAADGGFGAVLSDAPPDLASLTMPSFDDEPLASEVAADVTPGAGERDTMPADGDRVGPVITPEFTVASIGEESQPEGPAPTGQEAPPPFPGFG